VACLPGVTAGPCGQPAGIDRHSSQPSQPSVIAPTVVGGQHAELDLSIDRLHRDTRDCVNLAWAEQGARVRSCRRLGDAPILRCRPAVDNHRNAGSTGRGNGHGRPARARPAPVITPRMTVPVKELDE
jgi:hypothetical protein